MTYDSALDTLNHSRRVDELLLQIIIELQDRLTRHDLSKLQEPEKTAFDEFTPKLDKAIYGSDEYLAFLKAMRVALNHHYANNRHHPEFFNEGIVGMSLIDVAEMLADWKAASERSKDGDLLTSLKLQKERFGFSEQLYRILVNTSAELGWI